MNLRSHERKLIIHMTSNDFRVDDKSRGDVVWE